MKKTLTINLGGIVYHIDDDAYRLLDNYLSNLKHYFRKQEGAEEIVDELPHHPTIYYPDHGTSDAGQRFAYCFD